MTERKREEDGNTKVWISQRQKSILDEIKKKFHSFWRVIIWLKIKIW